MSLPNDELLGVFFLLIFYAHRITLERNDDKHVMIFRVSILISQDFIIISSCLYEFLSAVPTSAWG